MNKKLLTLILLCALVMTGCARTFFVGTEPSSHFEYPNSNVTAMQTVQGQASRSGFGPMLPTSQLKRDAVNDALRKAPGADKLINMRVFQRTSSFLFINTLTLIVEGEAANVEIGRQQLGMVAEDES
ncbi:MAG: hypothetical protein ACXIUB_06775 [Wenzhouxiangella sp.]